MIAWVLFLLNLIAFGLMIWRGSWIERSAVALILTAIVAEIFAQNLFLGDWKVGVAAVNLVLFLGLWILCERGDRWWLVFVSGFQFMTLLTHLLPLVSPDALIGTGVIARRGVWIAITLTLFLAPWEAWADRKYRSGSHDLRPSRRKPPSPQPEG